MDGGWTPAQVPDWRGLVSCEEPLVAIAFLHAGHVIEWCKSERDDAANLKVRLALYRYDSQGLDVQVCFSVGHSSRRRRSILASAAYLPAIVAQRELTTGIIEPFAVVDGDPRIELSLLLLARWDVRSARCGLWRLRKVLAPSVPEPFAHILTYGRSGKLHASYA